MSDIKVTMVGNLCADPMPRRGRNGTRFASLRVAVNEGRMTDNGWVEGPTTFVGVTAFDPLATGVLRSLRSGDPVIVQGRMRVSTWVDDKGQQRSAPEVRASHIGPDLSKGAATFIRFGRGEAGRGESGHAEDAHRHGDRVDDVQHEARAAAEASGDDTTREALAGV